MEQVTKAVLLLVSLISLVSDEYKRTTAMSGARTHEITV
jgi:hypothetical protein